jgi:hypothetical protein
MFPRNVDKTSRKLHIVFYLFNDVVFSSGYTASKGRMIDEW